LGDSGKKNKDSAERRRVYFVAVFSVFLSFLLILAKTGNFLSLKVVPIVLAIQEAIFCKVM
jgi:hypothetical protein